MVAGPPSLKKKGLRLPEVPFVASVPAKQAGPPSLKKKGLRPTKTGDAAVSFNFSRARHP